METMERKKPCTRRSFTPEFKADIVDHCRAGDRTIGQVARDFDLTESAVRKWVEQAEVDGGLRAGMTTEERKELTELRRKNRQVRDSICRCSELFEVSKSAYYEREVGKRRVGRFTPIVRGLCRNAHGDMDTDQHFFGWATGYISRLRRQSGPSSVPSPTLMSTWAWHT